MGVWACFWWRIFLFLKRCIVTAIIFCVYIFLSAAFEKFEKEKHTPVLGEVVNKFCVWKKKKEA
jgi:hypothetical protein